MKYFKINYSALKDYILEQKDKYNLADIAYLLDHGYINQQQYEDLMTIVGKPIYDYKNFMEVDKGYYRQQGPLSKIQVTNDILASAKPIKDMKRLSAKK